jgi:predicted dehydrogenase
MTADEAKLRIGIIGLGFMGQSHFANCQATGLARVTAVADYEPARRAGQSPVAGNVTAAGAGLDMTGVEAFAEGSDLIERADVDAVYLCVPTACHADLAIQAARRGLHVFCEKPMAISLPEAAAMVSAAREAGVRLMVGHCLRFWPEFQYLATTVKSGRLGALRSLAISRLGSVPVWSWHDWMRDETQSGGGLLDLHIHDVDVVEWLLGAPQAISARGRNTGSSKAGIDWVEVSYDYGPGLSVQSRGGWLNLATYRSFEYTYDAQFDGGWVRCHSAWEPHVVEYPAEGGEALHPVLAGDAYLTEDTFFLRCLAEGIDPATVISPEDAYTSLAMALREVDSVRAGGATLAFPA